MLALNTLQDVTRSDAYASIALGNRLRESKLDQRDKDLVTELVYGTLERLLSIDYMLDARMERPNADSLVRDILRVGAYQILYLTRIPGSAAVDESVKLAKAMQREPFAGFINAVLRTLLRDKEAGTLGWPDPEGDPVRYLSVMHSMPEWIVARLIDAYGMDEAERIAGYRPDEERTMTVRRTKEMVTPAAFEAMMTQKGWTWKPARLEGCYYVSGIGDVGIDKAYLEGLYSIQGEGSVLAAMAVSPRRAGNILDACAAPGGKTACIAALMEGTGRVHAWDIHEHRVEMIRSMVKRLRLYSVRPAVRDAAVLREELLLSMDAVLVDAPCTGFGVMLSKPDVKSRQSEESLAALVEVQKALLDTCCQYVKPGGTLVYSTCTILPEENSGQVERFLERHPEFTPDGDGLREALPEFIRDRVEGCMLQLQAHRDHVEGFFIARMRRRDA